MKREREMDNSPTSKPDARMSQRSPETLLVSYTTSADRAPEFTETYDIASGGLAMLTNASLETDAEIVVGLELRGGAHPKLTLTANVRWSTYDPLLQKFRTGVSFISRTPEFERELLHYIDTLHHLRNLGAL
jgi:c-di-GMP-binding flagellar brake protein YcgR